MEEFSTSAMWIAGNSIAAVGQEGQRTVHINTISAFQLWQHMF